MGPRCKWSRRFKEAIGGRTVSCRKKSRRSIKEDSLDRKESASNKWKTSRWNKYERYIEALANYRSEFSRFEASINLCRQS